jgi:hypothetical protein
VKQDFVPVLRLFTIVDGVKEYTTVVLEIGKDNEGYWTSLNVIAQIKNKAMAAFQMRLLSSHLIN